MLYATYAKSFKSGGVNLSGIPNRVDGTPATELATVEPERINHFQLGAKTEFWGRWARVNFAAFRTDISGQPLPGVSKWAISYGIDYSLPGCLAGAQGSFFAALDGNYRSRWSSSPSPSAFMWVDAYSVNNVRAGFRADRGWEVQGWMRNLFDAEYFDFLTAQSGSAGLIVGQPGDPRTWGGTASYRF